MTDTSSSSAMASLLFMQIIQHDHRGTTWVDFLKKIIMALFVQVLSNSSVFTSKLRELYKCGTRGARKARFVKAKITLRWNVMYSSDVSVEYRAVMDRVYKHLTDPGTRIQQGFRTEHVYIGGGKYMNTIVLTNPDDPVRISDNIMVTQKNTVVSGSDDNTYLTYSMCVSPCDDNYETVNEFIDRCVLDYNEKQLAQVKNPHIFIFTGSHKETSVPMYQEIEFKTTKSFENLFFDSKAALIKRLDDFTNNEARYQKLGIPYTCGMMFTGLPGCGKTSCIKAIANYTKRHIVSVPVHKIKSIQTLKDIFLTANINGVHIPNDKRIYVFEEIDCGEWEKLVRSRKLAKSDPLSTKEDEVTSMLLKSVCQTAEKKVQESDSEPPLTLGDLLELLDGIVEMPGRMIIMTSNHPENIDEALIRPGRIDEIIEFVKLRRTDINDIYKLWFNCGIPQHVYEHIRDYTFSQAEIGNLFATMDMDHIHTTLGVSAK